MKNLIKPSIVIVIILSNLQGYGQLKPPTPKYNSRPLIERQKVQEKRVLTMIAINLALFATNEYAINSNSKELRNVCTGAFFTVNSVGAIWVFNINAHTDNRPFKTRIKRRLR